MKIQFKLGDQWDWSSWARRTCSPNDYLQLLTLFNTGAWAFCLVVWLGLTIFLRAHVVALAVVTDNISPFLN